MSKLSELICLQPKELNGSESGECRVSAAPAFKNSAVAIYKRPRT
jgi:hypothetical protein